jgi:hypothetical protein
MLPALDELPQILLAHLAPCISAVGTPWKGIEKRDGGIEDPAASFVSQGSPGGRRIQPLGRDMLRRQTNRLAVSHLSEEIRHHLLQTPPVTSDWIVAANGETYDGDQLADPRLLSQLTPSGRHIVFAPFEAPFREAPVAAVTMLEQKVPSFAIPLVEEHKARRALFAFRAR